MPCLPSAQYLLCSVSIMPEPKPEPEPRISRWAKVRPCRMASAWRNKMKKIKNKKTYSVCLQLILTKRQRPNERIHATTGFVVFNNLPTFSTTLITFNPILIDSFVHQIFVRIKHFRSSILFIFNPGIYKNNNITLVVTVV